MEVLAPERMHWPRRQHGYSLERPKPRRGASRAVATAAAPARCVGAGGGVSPAGRRSRRRRQRRRAAARRLIGRWRPQRRWGRRRRGRRRGQRRGRRHAVWRTGAVRTSGGGGSPCRVAGRARRLVCAQQLQPSAVRQPLKRPRHIITRLMQRYCADAQREAART